MFLQTFSRILACALENFFFAFFTRAASLEFSRSPYFVRACACINEGKKMDVKELPSSLFLTFTLLRAQTGGERPSLRSRAPASCCLLETMQMQLYEMQFYYFF